MDPSDHIGQATDAKINILMVDDQPGKLLSYEAMLGGLGENLIKAQSGMEALEHLLKTDIALVLMDVSMPGMDGFETAQMIHAHPRFQDTPIFFVSGIHVTDLDRVKGYRHGTGVGLSGMRERLRQLGGTLLVQSNSRGTRVTTVLPRPRDTATASQEVRGGSLRPEAAR